ncbi:Ig-like domain-containing protein [Rhodoblastus sp. 17X3]|uniref:beta strand repeat-containing protein n=1 Tax=Rhodoblastus sp. 17X3 TaxID=3047026 RepID=UPI0024B7F891|nr:Ig-like domain-containing protein [Rhodoblastus sp. 17X3]MDI9847308.1 Ig-like domain-containing protein [Rhodoblastus sp. 17X3]
MAIDAYMYFTGLNFSVDDGLDTPIGLAQEAAVPFTITGLDPTYAGVVTFTDINNQSVTVDITGGQTGYVVDLSSLADGAIISSLQLNPNAQGAFAPVAGNIVVLDTRTNESAISDIAVMTGTDGQNYLNAANFNNGTNTLTGAAEAGDTVVVSVNGGAAQAATVAEDGTWAFVLTGLTNGQTVSAAATATDLAGNTATSDTFSFTVDTTPPTESAISDSAVTTGADGRNYISAAHFSDGSTTLTGHADPGDIVELITPIGSSSSGAGAGKALPVYPIVAGDGSWSYTLAGLADGQSYTLVAVATDTAGNVAASDPFSFTVDTTTSESAISDSAVTVGTDGQNYINANHFNNGSTTLTGQAEAGDIVELNLPTNIGSSSSGAGAGKAAFATVAPDGSWSYTLAGLVNGQSYTATATAIDPAGNIATSAAFSFTVDTTPPTESAISDSAIVVGPDGVNYINAAHFSDGSTVLTGQADPGDEVWLSGPPGWNLSEGGGNTFRFYPVVAADGSWSYTLTGLADGQSYTLTAVAIDAAGNVAASDPFSFTVDTTTSESAISDSAVTVGTDGQNYINANHFNNGSTTLTGQAEAGDIVELNLPTNIGSSSSGAGAGKAAFATVAPDGSWSYTLAGLVNGQSYTATATAIDPAGNIATSAAFSFTVDTTPPTESAISDSAIVVGPDGVNYINAAHFSDGSTVLTGQADPGDIVELTLPTNIGASSSGAGAGEPVPVMVAPDGSWSYKMAGLVNGQSYTISAIAIDPAGNTTTSEPFSFTVDASQPPQPSITSAAYAGNVWSLTGNAEAGSTVTVYDGGAKLNTTLAGQNGVWTFATGENNSLVRNYQVTATDAAGNTSVLSAPYYEGTPGNDVFSFATESALAAAAAITGNGGTDTIMLAAPATLTDADFARVYNVQDLALTGASNVTLGANAAGLAAVIVGNGATSVNDGNAGTLTVNAAAMGMNIALTLVGSANFVVTGLRSNLAATAVSGGLNVTTGVVAALSIATGSGANTINAGAMTQGEILTLTGGAAAVTIGGDLAAGSDSGALKVTAAGTGRHVITTGGGNDTIVALQGDDTIAAGGGADAMNVLGHTVADTFVYRAPGDSTPAGYDTIAGFSATGQHGSVNDLLDFSQIAGVTGVYGGLSSASQLVPAHDVAWLYDPHSNQTLVFANATSGALSQTSASLLAVDLIGGNYHLFAGINIKA